MMERLAATFQQLVVLHPEAPSLHGIACTSATSDTAYHPVVIGRSLLKRYGGRYGVHQQPREWSSEIGSYLVHPSR